MADRSTGCVYCGEGEPFTGEHVIPAGLGAGDEWQLRDLVCQRCNNAFSTFELRVMRSGAIGFARQINQPAGRARGSKTEPPTFDGVSLLTREDGAPVEAVLRADIVPLILPHITQRGDFLEGSGTDLGAVTALLGNMEEMLQTQVVLMQARPAKGELYKRVDLNLEETGYAVISAQLTELPPKDAFWLEALSDDRHDPSVLQRRSDSIAVQVKAADPAAAARLLSLIKANLPHLRESLAQIKQADIPQPDIKTRTQQPSQVDVARFIAKIGFNLLAYTHGDSVCRDRKFDELCEFIRTGSSHRLLAPWPDSAGLAPLFRKLFGRQHWMLLAPMPGPAGGPMRLAFACSFYGMQAQMVMLTEDAPPALGDHHVIAAVDFRANRVERFDLEDLAVLMRERFASHLQP
jgi:hypothetical protein